MAEILSLIENRLVLLLGVLLVGTLLEGLMPPLSRLRLSAYQAMWQQAESLQRKLNRTHRSTATLVYRGLIYVGYFIVGAVLLALLVGFLISLSPLALLVEMLILWLLMPAYGLFRHMRQFGGAVQKSAAQVQELAAQRKRGQLPKDASGKLRIGIEYLAESASDKLLASVFYYLCFGLVGVLIVRSLHLLDEAVGYQARGYRAFGWAAATLDDVAQWLPARLSVILWALAGLLTPGVKLRAALRDVAADAGRSHSRNAGWPLAMVAGLLGISLCGPRMAGGELLDEPWLGRGSAQITLADYRRALALYAAFVLWLILLMIALLFLLQRTFPI